MFNFFVFLLSSGKFRHQKSRRERKKTFFIFFKNKIFQKGEEQVERDEKIDKVCA